MTGEGMKLQWIEKSKISKYAEGVDPHDPTSVPYEVIETSRELSDEETKNVVKMIEGMKLGEIAGLDEKISKKRADLKKLNEVE